MRERNLLSPRQCLKGGLRRERVRSCSQQEPWAWHTPRGSEQLSVRDNVSWAILGAAAPPLSALQLSRRKQPRALSLLPALAQPTASALLEEEEVINHSVILRAIKSVPFTEENIPVLWPGQTFTQPRCPKRLRVCVLWCFPYPALTIEFRLWELWFFPSHINGNLQTKWYVLDGKGCFSWLWRGGCLCGKSFFRSADIIFQRWQMVQNLHYDLAYRFMVGSWYEKEQKNL